jgi:hypothetical protein
MSKGNVTISIEEYDHLRNYSKSVDKEYKKKKESYENNLKDKVEKIQELHDKIVEKLVEYKLFFNVFEYDVKKFLDANKWREERFKENLEELEKVSFWNIKKIKSYVKDIISLEDNKFKHSELILRILKELKQLEDKHISELYRYLDYHYRK